MLLKLVSWNVNGLRAIARKPDWDWFARTDAHIVGLQETKAHPDQLQDDLRNPAGWESHWSWSRIKKGYSGVAVFARRPALHVSAELPHKELQDEGRLLHLEYPEFHFFNVYFPNGGAAILDEAGKPTGDFKRIPYKMAYFDAFFEHAQACRREKPIVVCGDFNIAHRAIDLARPQQNEKNTGFLPEERAVLDRFTDMGYVDTFRHVHGEEAVQYSWWSYRTRARAKNIGWRIDYFFVSQELLPAVRDAWIESDVHGSDHCPVGLMLEF
jgi:exodeoxyribonuclease-3